MNVSGVKDAIPKVPELRQGSRRSTQLKKAPTGSPDGSLAVEFLDTEGEWSSHPVNLELQKRAASLQKKAVLFQVSKAQASALQDLTPGFSLKSFFGSWPAEQEQIISDMVGAARRPMRQAWDYDSEEYAGGSPWSIVGGLRNYLSSISKLVTIAEYEHGVKVQCRPVSTREREQRHSQDRASRAVNGSTTYPPTPATGNRSRRSSRRTASAPGRPTHSQPGTGKEEERTTQTPQAGQHWRGAEASRRGGVGRDVQIGAQGLRRSDEGRGIAIIF